MLVEAAIGALSEIAISGGLKRLTKTEIVIKASTKLAMIPMNYLEIFNGLYTYSLVKYGSTKPPELLSCTRTIR